MNHPTPTKLNFGDIVSVVDPPTSPDDALQALRAIRNHWLSGHRKHLTPKPRIHVPFANHLISITCKGYYQNNLIYWLSVSHAFWC
jgi:hypothetical protein